MSLVDLPNDILDLIVKYASVDWQTLCMLRLCSKVFFSFIPSIRFKITYMDRLFEMEREIIERKKGCKMRGCKMRGCKMRGCKMRCCNNSCPNRLLPLSEFGYPLNLVKMCYVNMDDSWEYIYDCDFLKIANSNISSCLVIRTSNILTTEIIIRNIPYCSFCTQTICL